MSAVIRRPITTTEDQSTTFIELFFDLVFVYAVTQTVSLVHEELSWAGVAHAVIVFWLVWWAWTQFTWALNSADTTHPAVEAVMLVATAIAFLMAVTVPDAFGDAGGWFAATYIAVRVVGLALYGRVAWDDVAKRAAVRRFALLSAGGLAAVAGGGVVGGDARAWWWAAAVLLDVVAAVAAGAAEGWDVRPDHFSERHGLFVIIALGESLIVAGAGLTGAERTTQTVAVAILAVAVTCGLWWSYFVTAKPLLDDAIRQRDQADRTHLARDVYSILHFVVVFGVVLLAVAVEEAVAHPHEALPAGGSLALAGGVVPSWAAPPPRSVAAATRCRADGWRSLAVSPPVSGSPTAHRSPGRCSWWPSDSSRRARRSERQGKRRGQSSAAPSPARPP